MTLKKPTTSNNVFQNIVRTVVREEITPVDHKIDMLGKRMDGLENHMDTLKDNVTNTIGKYVDKVLTSQDQVMGELKTIREEQTVLSSEHSRVLDLEDKVEKLEKIHPQGQHLTA